MEKVPLVSVVILTYNSANFIIDALESVKKQIYPRVEIVISDDGSTDDTCSLAEEWIAKNSASFEMIKLISSFKNRGTCANYNLGVYNSHGEYIKTLDGDDRLANEESISRFVHFQQHSKLCICISDINIFTDEDRDLKSLRASYDYY